MPDSWRITGNLPWGTATPGPTSLELASYCIAEEGIDFDFGSMFQNTFVENPARDGGRLAIQQSGVRQFRFPLRLASSWPGPGGLSGLEEFLRRIVKTPAHASAGFIDLLPENASYTIRFDILDGRLDRRNYSVYRQRVARTDTDLVLSVQPFGYSPTEILLASAAYASGPYFTTSWNPGSIIGDVPGLAKLSIITPVLASGLGNNPMPDGLYWSMSRKTGATVMWVPTMLFPATAALGPTVLATYQADPFSPCGVVLRLQIGPTYGATYNNTAAMFKPLLRASQGDLAPYRGRFRVLAWMRSSPSQNTMWQIMADESTTNVSTRDAASAYPIATLVPQGHASWSFGFPSAYQLLDLGEHTFPPIASGFSAASEGWNLQLWISSGTSGITGIASPCIECGGIALLPADADSGILPMGMQWPSSFGGGGGVNFAYQFQLNSITNSALLSFPNEAGSPGLYDTINAGALGNIGVVADPRLVHVGGFPFVGTAVNIDVIGFDKQSGAASYSLNQFLLGSKKVGASVSYRPRFAFLRGL